MTLFPTTYEQFLTWAEDTAADLAKRTNGQVRLGKNKLAAALANNLPGVKPNFNINTLKNHLSLQTGKANPPHAFNVEYSEQENTLIAIMNTNMLRWVQSNMRDTLEHLVEGTLPILPSMHNETAMWVDRNKKEGLDTLLLKRLNGMFATTYPSLLESTYHNNKWLHELTYLHMQDALTATVFVKLLHTHVNNFFTMFAEHGRAANKFSRLESGVLEAWLCYAIEEYDGDARLFEQGMNKSLEHAQTTVLGPVQFEYQVVVKAIVRGDHEFLAEFEVPPEWEGYDHTVGDEETDTVLRYDTVVTVVASDKNEAIEKAKDDAPPLGITFDIGTVDLWVDDDCADNVVLINTLSRKK
jgi:hypothetical protein